jgi:hypothetical protein
MVGYLGGGVGVAGHVAACGCTPYYLSCLEACTRGYLICRVPTVALGPTLGVVMNQQVGPLSRHPVRLF